MTGVEKEDTEILWGIRQVSVSMAAVVTDRVWSWHLSIYLRAQKTKTDSDLNIRGLFSHVKLEVIHLGLFHTTIRLLLALCCTLPGVRLSSTESRVTLEQQHFVLILARRKKEGLNKKGYSFSLRKFLRSWTHSKEKMEVVFLWAKGRLDIEGQQGGCRERV